MNAPAQGQQMAEKIARTAKAVHTAIADGLREGTLSESDLVWNPYEGQEAAWEPVARAAIEAAEGDAWRRPEDLTEADRQQPWIWVFREGEVQLVAGLDLFQEYEGAGQLDRWLLRQGNAAFDFWRPVAIPSAPQTDDGQISGTR